METELSVKQHYWLNQVKEAEASNLNYRAYAESANVDLKSLYNWKSYFLKKDLLPGVKRKSFVKAKIEVENQDQQTASIIANVRFPNGIEFVLNDLSRTTLRELFSL